MYINVAVLKETQPHEHRVALVPAVTIKLIKLGAKLHMQSGAGEAISVTDAAFTDVSFMDDRLLLVRDAGLVLAVQAPALEVVSTMKEGAILVSFIYAQQHPALVQCLLDKKSPVLPWSACHASRARSPWIRCPASLLCLDIMLSCWGQPI